MPPGSRLGVLRRAGAGPLRPPRHRRVPWVGGHREVRPAPVSRRIGGRSEGTKEPNSEASG
jgi:hypothetical protein